MPCMKHNHPAIILAIACLFIGIHVTTHYGESWDELQFYKYADRAIAAYTSWPRAGQIELTGNTYDNYGPAYVIAVDLGARLLTRVLPFTTSDTRHLIYFATYLVGIWTFYALSRRWLSRNASIGATLLFATQPLLWGHAFISPKDIPFLSFFLLSLLFGLRLFDSLESIQLPELNSRSGRTLLALTALWLAATIGLFLFTDSIHALIANLVQSAKAGGTNIFSLIASDLRKVDAEIYVQRYFVLFLGIRSIIFLVTSAFLLFTLYRNSPAILHSLLSILFPAILLGVTTSIRILGPFAAIFLAFYALRKHGKNAILPLAIYAIIALIAIYLTWPYLWLDPIGHFTESMKVMSQYPWKGQVLFNGVEYSPANLPWTYLPFLLGIQLTEPVWALFIVGLVAAGWKQREKRELLLLTIFWFIIPLVGFIVLRPPLYDNFRQIFFILPPVFWMAGVVFEKIKKPVLQFALIALVILPGVVDGIRLHPYEYIYYNRCIGGVDGAFRKFEMDYWGTSYRAAAEYVNKIAPPKATIWVEGPEHLFALYARKDLKIYSSYEIETADHYDYVIATTRHNLDETAYPDAKIIYEITRGGAVLAVIKKP